MARPRRTRSGSLFLALILVPGVGRAVDAPAASHTFWRTSPVACSAPLRAPQVDFSCQSADVVTSPEAAWIAYSHAESTTTSGWSIHVVRNPNRTALGDSGAVETVSFPGTMPRLAWTGDARLVLVSCEELPTAASHLVVRCANAEGSWWSDAMPLPAARRGRLVSVGRLSSGPRGLLLPAVWHDLARDVTEMRCVRSEDGGLSWTEGGSVPLLHGEDADAEVEQTADGLAVLIVRVGDKLSRSVSHDSGFTWDALAPVALAASTGPMALAREGDRLTLAWTEPPSDSSVAAPGLQGLRRAVSADAGATWTAQPRLVLRPGSLPFALRLASSPHDLVLLVAVQHREQSSLACVSYGTLAPALAGLPTPEHARGRYTLDTDAARAALEVLAAHTLYRPQRAGRLFVEAYFMRSLVAAHTVLSPDDSADRWFDTHQGLERAIAFADSLVATQRWVGFWHVGYAAIYYADMAAAVAIFPALEPYVDAARLAKYQAAAERFVGGLEREHMFLPSGAVGGGRNPGVDPVQTAVEAARPYLVSTALVGLETEAWLFHRTGRLEYRQRALAALDYTLSQIVTDGFSEELGRKEGCLRVASYVQEGWMAMEQLLADPAVTERLRTALVPHVQWLLQSQRPDGTWADAVNGSFARTPGIVNFLIWYDQRCQATPAVRAAVQRASAVLTDPERWPSYGLFRAGPHYEVLRALSGRAIAALAAEHSVP
jgi:hypothetical protein